MTKPRAEVRLQPGIAPSDVLGLQAPAYSEAPKKGLALALGAGNVSSIMVTDTLEELFIHNRTVLLKLNPVNAYLEPLLRRGFVPLLEVTCLTR